MVRSIVTLNVFDSPGSRVSVVGESVVQPHVARILPIRNVFRERFVTSTSDLKFEVATTLLPARLNDLNGPGEKDSATIFDSPGLHTQNSEEIGIAKTIAAGRRNDRCPFREGLEIKRTPRQMKPNAITNRMSCSYPPKQLQEFRPDILTWIRYPIYTENAIPAGKTDREAHSTRPTATKNSTNGKSTLQVNSEVVRC